MTEPRNRTRTAYTFADVGQPWSCFRCGKDHSILRPHAESTTAEKDHLYIDCKGSRYFIGQIVEPGKR